MSRSRTPLVLALLTTVLGCDEPPAPTGAASAAGSAAKPSATTSAPAPSASAATSAPAASASAAAVVEEAGPPVCARSSEKVVAENVSTTAGLTTKGFKKDLAIGFSDGAPRVLVLDEKGADKVLEVERGEKSKLSKDKGTWRNLMRVSPRSLSADKAKAFIDYRDDSKDKTRHVWCGPADANDTFLEYEGTSWLDLDPKPTGEDKKKLFSWKKLGGYVELRDCRTFVTLEKDEAWAIGSVLRGTEKPDGSNEWKLVAVVDFGKNDEEIVLSEIPLKGDPPKLTGGFEIPTMRRVGDKGYVVAARVGGSLWVATLDTSRKLVGAPKFYPGFPTGIDISTTAKEVVILSGVGLGKEKTLKGLVIPRDTLKLPEKFTDVGIKPMDASGDSGTQFTAPELVTDGKGQLWLAYVEGPKEKGHLRIAPVGADLQPTGRSFPVTTGDAFATEVRLHALADGGIAAAYIRTNGKKTELVTEQFSCKVQP